MFHRIDSAARLALRARNPVLRHASSAPAGGEGWLWTFPEIEAVAHERRTQTFLHGERIEVISLARVKWMERADVA